MNRGGAQGVSRQTRAYSSAVPSPLVGDLPRQKALTDQRLGESYPLSFRSTHTT